MKNVDIRMGKSKNMKIMDIAKDKVIVTTLHKNGNRYYHQM